MTTITPRGGGNISRRRFLGYGLAGAAGLILGDRIFPRAWAAAPGAVPLPPAGAAGKPPAKAVIQIWLWGGPSHLDTFDPKPDAGRDYCGNFNRPIATNVDGIVIGQMLPMLAKMADKYAILRGMTHGNNGHETAAYLVQTGRKAGEVVFPGIGAVITYFKGPNGGYKGMLPPYITITTPQGRFSEAGFLGSKYKPFATGGDPSRDPFAVEGIVAEGITEERQRDRRQLLETLDRFGGTYGDQPLTKSLDECREQAYAMILGKEGKTFTLSEEKPELRDRYGRTRFGQSCLLARRLVERGVPFITINHQGWDTHKEHFQAMNQKLPELDRVVSALLQDLADHGLLDSTIVWVSGEFGRTPKVQWEVPWNGGRGHYGKAFSALLAGGGFRGGVVVGKTDARGETVVERPVYPWDLTCSIFERVGIPADAQLMSPQGEKYHVSPFAAKEISPNETGGLLRELV